MDRNDKMKLLVWLRGEVKTPPMSAAARVEIGVLLRQLQRGISLGMPFSKPLPSIGSSVHEIRVRDGDNDWRLVYRIDSDAIVIVDVFAKRSRATPHQVIETAKNRLRRYDAAGGGKEKQ
jgi:phage-related protein